MRLTTVVITLCSVGCSAIQRERTAVTAVARAEPAELVLVNRDREGLAIQGYDPVAYFTQGKPTKGDPRYRATYGGATYQFASAAHRDQFSANPSAFAPAYGGYCGYAASIRKLSPISPEYWQILDGRLILQHNQRAWDAWNKDVPGNVRKADANWPELVRRNATGARNLVNVNRDGVAIQGFDPVAYFREKRPVRDTPEIQAVYNGAIYYFSSVENKDAFEQDPAGYAPKYGGFCGYAASINKKSPIDPMFWQIEGGRLILQHTQKAYDLFNRDVAGCIERADRNWPGLVERYGK